MKVPTKILALAAVLILPALGACDYSLTDVGPVIEIGGYTASDVLSVPEQHQSAIQTEGDPPS